LRYNYCDRYTIIAKARHRKGSQSDGYPVEAGRFLGLGSKAIEVNADAIEQSPIGLLRLGGAQVRSLSEQKGSSRGRTIDSWQ
jgi:hypothetical protein